jgi:metallophosphoesterase superfamily enzyme
LDLITAGAFLHLGHVSFDNLRGRCICGNFNELSNFPAVLYDSVKHGIRSELVSTNKASVVVNGDSGHEIQLPLGV